MGGKDSRGKWGKSLQQETGGEEKQGKKGAEFGEEFVDLFYYFSITSYHLDIISALFSCGIRAAIVLIAAE